MGNRGQKEDRDLKYQLAFGNRVKYLREKLAWTQGDLAAISGVSEAQISVIENGHQSPRLHTLKSIALALGITPSKLLEFAYDFKINTSFNRGKVRRTGITSHIKKLYDENFFKKPKSVNEVIEQCLKKYDLLVRSAETSGVLILLVKRGDLKKVNSEKNRNLYQNR